MDVRFLTGVSTDGFFAMAADEVLLERGAAVLRLYTWAPLFLSIGYFQNPSRALNRPFLLQQGITVIRRPTGGKGVLHSSDLSYSAVLPEGFAGQQYGATIRLITGSICRGLRLLGCDAYLNENANQEANPSAECFAHTTAHEIMARGKKIAGCAHLSRKERFLEQGSILLGLDRGLERGCFLSDEGTASPPSPAMTSLTDETGITHAVSEVMKAIEKGFREYAGWNLVHGELTGEERAKAEELAEKKYRLPSWNERL